MNDLSGLSDDDLKEYTHLVIKGKLSPDPGKTNLDAYLEYKGLIDRYDKGKKEENDLINDIEEEIIGGDL